MQTTDLIPAETVVDLFVGGEFHNDFLQCRARDWYWIGRATIPMPTWHDGTLLRFQNLIAVTDAASGAFLYYDKSPHGSPSAAHLLQAIATAIEVHGRPRKGVVVMPTAWASFRRICHSELIRFVDLPGFIQCGTDFDETTLATRIEVERWIRAKDLTCSFTPYVSRGDPAVGALETPTLEREIEAN